MGAAKPDKRYSCRVGDKGDPCTVENDLGKMKSAVCKFSITFNFLILSLAVLRRFCFVSVYFMNKK